MNPVDFPEANRTFTKPPSMTDEECLPLHVHDDGAQFISCWQPTEEERQAIAAGAPVRLAIVGRGHPPVWVDVAGVAAAGLSATRDTLALVQAALDATRRERDDAELSLSTARAELARERELREDHERDRASWREGCERWNGAANALAAALLEAMAAAQVFHGRVGWELYRDHSPEMERWRELLVKVGAEIPAPLHRGGVAPPPREEPPRG